MADPTGFDPPRGRWLRRVLTWPLALALILGVVAASNVVTSHIPGSEQRARPFVQTGRIGENVKAMTFQATVESVRGARAITAQFRQYESEGVFVIVKVKITARTASMRIQSEAVRDSRDRLFRATDRLFQPMGEGYYVFQPGVPVEGEIVFEVPKDAAVGLKLELWKEYAVVNEHQTLVQVPLDIDAAMVEKWWNSAASVELMQPEVVS